MVFCFMRIRYGPYKDPATALHSMVNSDAIDWASDCCGGRMPTENAVLEVSKSYQSTDPSAS